MIDLLRNVLALIGGVTLLLLALVGGCLMVMWLRAPALSPNSDEMQEGGEIR